MSIFKNKYGYFSDDGKEYIITNPKTPKPWVNLISNGHYSLVISQLNGGFSWLDNSNLNRITRWHQDLVTDQWGKYLYIRDDQSGLIWSPTIHPVGQEADEYICRHGMGYTSFATQNHQIESRLRIFVPFDDNLEIWTLRLTNLSDKARKLGLFTYFEWLLGAAPDSHREFHKIFIETKFDSADQILTAGKRLWEVPASRGHWNTNWPYTAYFACSEPVDGFETDKGAFLGQYGKLSAPKAVRESRLSGRQGRWTDAVSSLHKKVTLNPGETVELHFFLGVEKSQETVVRMVQKYRSAPEIEDAFNSVKNYWENYLTRTTVSTPDQGLNLMTNVWLKYQVITGRIWSRAAYYQQSGAYGFRDQLQDSQIFLYLQPEKTKEQLLLHAAHQFKDGRVLHWWHPLSEQGHDARMSDDLLWMPFVAVQYLKETGDWSVLDAAAPYYDDNQTFSLLDHCLRAIDLALSRFSPRGLPLILAGDWNDGLSAVGLEGKGESVWLAHFLYYILTEFDFILKKIDLKQKAAVYSQRAEALIKAINQFGWDGEWYWRASKDNGELIGSHKNKEGKIFLNAQTWAIIAGTADSQRKKALLEKIVEHLNSKVGPLLFAPAFSEPDEEIGYLTRYAPGVRENGGVYTHAATWAVWAACLLGKGDLAYDFYRKLCPAHKWIKPDEYLAEPYVTPGNMDGPNSPFYGRGGWTWYTGSAAWLFRVTIDNLLGIQADYEGLRIRPVFPTEWENVSVKRYFRGKTYHIEFLTREESTGEDLKILAEGRVLQGDLIPEDKENERGEVHVLVYRKSDLKTK